MRTKILFILFSLGTFNYFLASTHDFNIQEDLINRDERKISTQMKVLGDLWSLTGNVSFITAVPEGELKIKIYPYGTCDIEGDIQCVARNQPLTEVAVNSEGDFIVPYLEEGRYTIYAVVVLANDDMVMVDAAALGGVNLDDFILNDEMDLQIAVSHSPKKEIVLK